MLPLLLIHEEPVCLVPVLTTFCVYPAGYRSRDHYHNVYHLVFMLEGSCALEKDSGSSTVTEGDLVVVDPGQKHLFSCGRKEARNFVFNFYLAPWTMWRDGLEMVSGGNQSVGTLEPHALTTPFRELFGVPGDSHRLTVDDRPRSWNRLTGAVQTFWNDTGHFMAERDPATRAQVTPWYLRRCTAFLYSVLETCVPSRYGPGVAAARPLPDVVRRAVDLLDARLESKFSLVDLAAGTGCTPNYLCTAFARGMGETPGRYANRRKIRHAADLLCRTTRSVTDIALTLGFSSSQHFCRNFRDEMGCAPTLYRRNTPRV